MSYTNDAWHAFTDGYERGVEYGANAGAQDVVDQLKDAGRELTSSDAWDPNGMSHEDREARPYRDAVDNTGPILISNAHRSWGLDPPEDDDRAARVTYDDGDET